MSSFRVIMLPTELTMSVGMVISPFLRRGLLSPSSMMASLLKLTCKSVTCQLLGSTSNDST
jgi:hypothetical protein